MDCFKITRIGIPGEWPAAGASDIQDKTVLRFLSLDKNVVDPAPRDRRGFIIRRSSSVQTSHSAAISYSFRITLPISLARGFRPGFSDLIQCGSGTKGERKALRASWFASFRSGTFGMSGKTTSATKSIKGTGSIGIKKVL